MEVKIGYYILNFNLSSDNDVTHEGGIVFCSIVMKLIK